MISLSSIDKKETLRYLHRGGGGKPLPELDEELSALLGSCEDILLSSIAPRYIYKVFDVASKEEASVNLENCFFPLEGKDISDHLSGCDRVILFAATLGSQVDQLIRISQINDMGKAVIYDAMASVAIEQVCDQIERAVKEDFKASFFTWRFSPGYGDFPIKSQRDFATILEMQKKIGLGVTDSFLLTPKKSVTAILGLSSTEVKQERRSCQSCNLYESCRFRREGGRCKS